MEYNEALTQISEIHAHLAKGEVYRGFRSLPVALSGVAGLAAAALEPRLAGADDLAEVLRYWMIAGIVCAVVGGSETALNYILHEDSFARRRSRRVWAQFAPGLAAGVALSWCIYHTGNAFLPLLPGLWSIVYSLAIFAARPYLPRASGWVAVWYLAAGCLWLSLPPADVRQFDWIVAGTFCVGQLAGAVVLFWNVERAEHA